MLKTSDTELLSLGRRCRRNQTLLVRWAPVTPKLRFTGFTLRATGYGATSPSSKTTGATRFSRCQVQKSRFTLTYAKSRSVNRPSVSGPDPANQPARGFDRQVIGHADGEDAAEEARRLGRIVDGEHLQRACLARELTSIDAIRLTSLSSMSRADPRRRTAAEAARCRSP